MNNIFNDYLRLDLFCIDIAEAWIDYRKSKNLSYTQADWERWVEDELMEAMELAYNDAASEVEE